MQKLAVSIKEAVQLTGLSNTTIYRRIEEGKLIARKSQGRTLIMMDDLKAYLESLPAVELEAA